MYGMTSNVPMTVENQHWVLCPTGEDRALKAEAVYAMSPEAAVLMVRKMFAIGAFLEELPHNENIRLATGNELPWNNDISVGFIIETEEASTLYFGTEGDARETYEFIYQGKPFTMRAATPDEKEASIRRQQVESDERDEEDFNYGFNVLYKMEKEEAAL